MIDMEERRLVQAVIVAGALVRIAFWLTAPVTGDATIHFSVARYIAENHAIPSFEPASGPNPFWWPPLFHIISAVLYKLTGVLTLAPLLFGILGLYAMSVFARAHYPRLELPAVSLLAFLPFHMYYSGIGYFETLIFLLAVAAFHNYISFLKSGEARNLAYTAVFCSLSAWTHYHGFVPAMAIGAHLFLKDRRRALAFMAAVTLMSCPWYVRNLVVFGNPVWPKLSAGYFPGDAAYAPLPFMQTLSQLASPGAWASVYLDFWTGAPNSGEDFASNAAAGRARYPLFDILLLPWFAATAAATILALWGVKTMRDGEAGRLPVIIIASCTIFFTANRLARMFIALMPFAVIYAAEGYAAIKFRWKHAALLAAFLLFVGGSYGYAYTYKTMRDPYMPFFLMMRERIPDGARVVMPFNVGECAYFSGRQCVRIGSAGGIPRPTADNMQEVLREGKISYVCCTSINWDEVSGGDRLICDGFKERTPFIDYSSGGAWGRCWKTGD